MSEKSLTELATAIRRQAEILAQEQIPAPPEGGAAEAPSNARSDLAQSVAEIVAVELSRTFVGAPDVDWRPMLELTGELKTLVDVLSRHEENLAPRILDAILDGIVEEVGPRLDRIDVRLRALAAEPAARPRRRGAAVAVGAAIIAAFLAGSAAAPLVRPHLERAITELSGML